MTEYLAKALHAQKFERFENMRCPKTYCKYREALKQGKSY